jgi:hypothetical protein
MKNLLDQKIELTFAAVKRSSMPDKNYEAVGEFLFNDDFIHIKVGFNDAEAFDELNELSYYEGKAKAIYEHFSHSFDEQLKDWIEEIS